VCLFFSKTTVPQHDDDFPVSKSSELHGMCHSDDNNDCATYASTIGEQRIPQEEIACVMTVRTDQELRTCAAEKKYSCSCLNRTSIDD